MKSKIFDSEIFDSEIFDCETTKFEPPSNSIIIIATTLSGCRRFWRNNL